MKDYNGMKITPLFNLCDYNIKIKDVCWNKIKMTSSKWIACCHRSSCCDSSRISNYDLKSPSNNNTTTTCFNTYSGRRNKCSPSISSSDNSTNAINNANNQSPSNSISSSTGFDWTNHSQSSFSSSSTTSANSIFFHQQQQSSTPKPKKLPPSNATPKYHDLSFPRHHRSKDDSILASSCCTMASSSTTQSIITLINPFEYLLINCETNDDTNCAQISPKQEIIAVSNEYWLAFYSIRDNNCLGTIQFPKKCLYWTWINGDTVAIITEDFVYHWCLSRPKSLDYVFTLDEEIRTNQIVDYNVDPLYGYWCAVTALSVNEDGEIGGKIQIFSQNYMQSQCIEAHSCMFASYQFDGNENESNLLIAVNRERIDLWKLYIIDLSSTSANNFKNRPLKSQQLMMHAFSPRTTINNSNEKESSSELGNHSEMISQPPQPPPFCDIPTHLQCDDDLGLIFILSKYGSIYICDLETGTPLYYDSIQQYTDSTAIFSVSYDRDTTCLMAICRKGQVLVIKILLKQLLEQRIVQKLQTNIYDRINERIQLRKSTNTCKRNSSTPNNNQGHGSHRRKINTNKDYNTRTVSIMVNNDKCDQINETTKMDDNLSHCRSSDDSVIDIIDLQQQDLSGSYPSYDYDDDDLEEEITRL